MPASHYNPIRHWYGKYSPIVSGAILVSFGAMFYVAWSRLLNLSVLVENYQWQVSVLATLLVIAAIFFVWWVVGSWRSVGQAERHGRGVLFVVWRLAILAIAALATYQIGRAGWETKGMIQDLIGASDRYRIYADAAKPSVAIFYGEIAWGSGRALADYLGASQSFKVIEFNSRGGSIVEAERIATLIESRQLATHVREVCISACTLAYVSGSTRTASRGAKFGFHRFAVSALGASATIDRLTRRYRNALLSHGVDVRFVDTALKTAPPQYWVPSERDLRLYGFVQDFD